MTYSPPSQANVTTKGPAFRLKEPAQEGEITFLTPGLAEELESGQVYTYVPYTSFLFSNLTY